MDIGIFRMRIFDGDKTMAFIDLAYGELIIKGFKIVNGNQGIFISFPREKGKDDRWWDTVICSNPLLSKKIEELALAEYKKLKGDKG